MSTGIMKTYIRSANLKLYAGERVRVEPYKGDSPLRRVSPLSGEWDDKYVLVHINHIGELSMEEHWRELLGQIQPKHIEGSSGLCCINEVVGKLGYQGHQYKYGSPLEEFLSDNSGAIEAILEWIVAHPCEEWVEALDSNLS